MITGLDLSGTRVVESKYDAAKGTDAATKFTLGTIDSRLMGMLKDQATTMSVDPKAPEEEVDFSISQNEVCFLACQYGLRGWTNLRDKQNNDIEFRTLKRFKAGQSYIVVDEQALRRVPQPVIVELGQLIIDENDLKPVDEGK